MQKLEMTIRGLKKQKNIQKDPELFKVTQRNGFLLRINYRNHNVQGKTNEEEVWRLEDREKEEETKRKNRRDVGREKRMEKTFDIHVVRSDSFEKQININKNVLCGRTVLENCTEIGFCILNMKYVLNLSRCFVRTYESTVLFAQKLEVHFLQCIRASARACRL